MGKEFQSTHPARGATSSSMFVQSPVTISIHAPREGCDCNLVAEALNIDISIHAPREGCDGGLDDTRTDGWDFNPRTPRGVRRTLYCYIYSSPAFQSTHPARGATSCGQIYLVRTHKFQSTHPARGATANFTKEQGVCLAQFAYLHKGKKAEHTKTNAPMLH